MLKIKANLKIVIYVVIMFIFVSCGDIKMKQQEIKTQRKESFFSSFRDYKLHSSKFRVGAETGSVKYHFSIKALTTAFFDEERYSAETIYILKHTSGDSIIIKTDDVPLLSHKEFQNFYYNHKYRADTIVDPEVFNKFFLTDHGDKIDVESFQGLPFLFLDVNFNGYPALLVRYDKGRNYYYYKVYGITSEGFNEVTFEPFTSIKSRTNQWCYGGSTEFDYKNKTIKVCNLTNESCSDHGTQIIDNYKLNPATDRFEKEQRVKKYEFD